jgi:hypothetical protein
VSEERFLIRTTGGPLDGETRVVPLSVLGQWPPPESLPAPGEGGSYVLRNHSQLLERPSTEFLMRGADYEWDEATP